MAEVKCETCGVILVDPRRKRLRSCAHYPLIVEQIDGQSVITIGTGRNGRPQTTRTQCSIDLAFSFMMNAEREDVKPVPG